MNLLCVIPLKNLHIMTNIPEKEYTKLEDAFYYTAFSPSQILKPTI